MDVPLVSSFVLSRKEGKGAYVHPMVEGDRYRFTVKLGSPPPEAGEGTKLGPWSKFPLSHLRCADQW